MTNEELRLAIAKAKGWTELHETKRIGIRGYHPTDHYWDNPPHWEEDIAAAWKLAEEMRRDNYVCPQVYLIDADDLWHVAIRTAGDQGYEDYADKDAPRAICLAYLAWRQSQPDQAKEEG